ncbi:MAG: hypothetical protein J7K21_07630 [Desulfurococcales archaeon]|nr:hypothetical protein [Desulfurococcales archaeon]
MNALGIRLLGLFLLVALFGAAAAMWSETLKINVTVHTGEVDVEWSSWSCSDTGADPQAQEFNNEDGKDVADCLVKVEETDDEEDVIKLNVTITNAYPGYSVVITGIVDNIGTIPVKLYDHNITGVDESALDVDLGIPRDTQIEPGENSTYTLTITVLQDAEENHVYSFEVILVFAQWNEVSP